MVQFYLYAQCKQWEFMHFQDFPYSSKHLVQINVGQKIMFFGLS